MKLIRCSERDVASLEKLKNFSASKQNEQPESYRNRVVVKPWGYEFLIFQNEYVAVWYLHIDKGHSTSMHCHPKKKTSLIVLSGQALCNTFYNRNYLTAVDGVIIENGVFHSTHALSKDGIDLIEVETPPDKTDLVRLNDQYGREGNGYEGMSEMKGENLEKYAHFYFEEPRSTEPLRHLASKFEVSIFSCVEQRDFAKMFRQERDQIYCSCRGQIQDGSGSVVVDVGDLAAGSFLANFDGLKVSSPATFLAIKPI